MKKYRKLPVTISAWHYTKDSEIPEELSSRDDITFKEDYALIKTLEGIMRASLNDYIIVGVKNELYACKPDVFEKTYEVESASE